MNIKRKDPTGKNHKLQDRGKYIVNARNGQLVSPAPTTEFKSLLRNFILRSYRKENRQEHTKLISDAEKNQIIEDLKNIQAIYNHTFNWSSDYRLNIVAKKATLKISEKSVLRNIKEDNIVEISYIEKKGRDGGQKEETMDIIPTYNEIKLKGEYLVYVPIWIIKFKSGKMSYTRRSLAASNTFVIDEIASCPKHFSFGKILGGRKQTYAVCEICGGAFCFDHIVKRDNSYFCEEDLGTLFVK